MTAGKRVEHSKLKAALATPDRDVAKPSKVVSTSITNQIAALKVGESWAKVQKVHGGVTVAEFSRTSNAMKEELRDSLRNRLSGAMARSGNKYSVEVGDCTSSARNLFLVAIVTCVGVSGLLKIDDGESVGRNDVEG